MYVEQSQPFEAVYAHGEDGLVGTVEVAIVDNDGNVVTGPTTTNITEAVVDGVPIGIYTWNAPAAPATVGQYSIVWSPDGTWDAETTSTPDELVVVATGSSGVLPPIPPPAEGGLAHGPCSAWTTTLAVAACCGVVNSTELDNSVAAASEEMYEASGRRYAGLCQQTVRPCKTDGIGCGVQVLSRGHLIGWDGDSWSGYDCGCSPLSRVKLAGQVREVTQVKIDGAIVDPSLYRVDEEMWLVRKDGGRWPRCQALSYDDTESGTFSVTYTYGQIPPVSGQQAATELACEIYRACNNDEACRLPSGVTRITRSGVTIERTFMARDADGVWRTGLPLVDLFLNRYNPAGLQRRATFWSASSRARYARRAG